MLSIHVRPPEIEDWQFPGHWEGDLIKGECSECREHTGRAHQQTGVAVYFCDSHGPWQRGFNENTNGLVRQYLPKGTDLSIYSHGRPPAVIVPGSAVDFIGNCIELLLSYSSTTPSTQPSFINYTGVALQF
jgi:IS30 family transposase